MVCQQCFEDRSLYILSLRDSTTSLLITSVLFTTCLPFSKPVRHHNQPLQGPPRFLCIILTPPTKHLCLEDEACQPINSSTAHTIYYKIIEFEGQNLWLLHLRSIRGCDNHLYRIVLLYRQLTENIHR